MGSGPLLPVSLSPFSGFLCCSSSPAGKGNPLLLLSPGARWEPRVVFRFLYCGLTLPHIKNSSHGCRDTMLLEGCRQLHVVACASSLGLCKPLLGAHSVVTPEEGVPYHALPDLGRVKVVGRCSLCPWPWNEKMKRVAEGSLTQTALPGLAVQLPGEQSSIFPVLPTPGLPNIRPRSSESMGWEGNSPSDQRKPSRVRN